MSGQCYHRTSLLVPSTSLPCREGQETPLKSSKGRHGVRASYATQGLPWPRARGHGGLGPLPPSDSRAPAALVSLEGNNPAGPISPSRKAQGNDLALTSSLSPQTALGKAPLDPPVQGQRKLGRRGRRRSGRCRGHGGPAPPLPSAPTTNTPGGTRTWALV